MRIKSQDEDTTKDRDESMREYEDIRVTNE